MKKSLTKKIEEYVASTKFPYAVYFTENPFKIDSRYWGCKYFFVYHSTHNIKAGFYTQAALEDWLNEED